MFVTSSIGRFRASGCRSSPAPTCRIPSIPLELFRTESVGGTVAGEPNYLDPDVWFELLRPAHRTGELDSDESESATEQGTGF